MAMNQHALKSIVDRVIAPSRFRLKGTSWYRNTPASLQVVDLQRSSYGGQYYLNVCFVPEGMFVDGLPTPKEQKCPIRTRVETLFPTIHDRLKSLLDLEDSQLDEKRRATDIEEVLENTLMPFLNSVEEHKAFKAAISSNQFENAAISSAAREHLGLGD